VLSAVLKRPLARAAKGQTIGKPLAGGTLASGPLELAAIAARSRPGLDHLARLTQTAASRPQGKAGGYESRLLVSDLIGEARPVVGAPLGGRPRRQ
jgi:hypothetical protein